MRTKLRSALTVAGVMGAAFLGLATAPPAQAADGSWTVFTARTTHCSASLRAKWDANNKNWAQATGKNFNGAYNCWFYLERSTNGGKDWYLISDEHWLYETGQTGATGWYWDDAGYQARACAKESSGRVCTPGY
jgi:hypothetical protein